MSVPPPAAQPQAPNYKWIGSVTVSQCDMLCVALRSLRNIIERHRRSYTNLRYRQCGASNECLRALRGLLMFAGERWPLVAIGAKSCRSLSFNDHELQMQHQQQAPSPSLQIGAFVTKSLIVKRRRWVLLSCEALPPEKRPLSNVFVLACLVSDS